MPSLEKQVRVFISSAFRDMHAEWDHLVTVAFPKLHEQQHSFSLAHRLSESSSPPRTAT